MKALLYYLVQVIVTSGILYTYYHFALRNKKFHRYNRFYLLAATVISITIPFLNIPVYFTQTETDSSFVLQTLTVFSSSSSDAHVFAVAHQSHQINWFSWQNLSYCFYILFASIALLRIIISLIKIRRIVKNNPVEQLENIRFINTNEPGTPFSFFRWLFWNRKIELHTEKGEQIFRHELFHIKQKHSWDILYMELLTVIFWINPFFHLIKKEVKAIHEFLADQFAITENTKWQYAELLLMQVLNTNQHLVNPFFHNQIKRRIAMITTSKKPSYQYLRKLMVLPVAAIVIGLFAFSYKQKKDNEASSGNSGSLDKTQLDDTTKLYPDTNILIKKTYPSPPKKSPSQEQLNIWQDSKKYGVWFDDHRIKNIELRKYKPSDFVLYNVSKLEKNATNYGKHYYQVTLLSAKHYAQSFPGDSQTYYMRRVEKTDTTKPFYIIDNKIFDKVDIEASFPGGDPKWRQYVAYNMGKGNFNFDKTAPEGTYTTVVIFIVDKDGHISDVKALTAHGYGMEEEAIRMIKNGPKWNPAVQNGKQVKAYRRQPITFVVTKGQTNFSHNAKTTSNDSNIVFEKVETEASFPGGELKWRQYLERNAKGSIALDKGAPKGTYTVIVQFIVDKEGNISDIRALTNHGFGMENEAVRVIKSGPKWNSAIQNGKQVKAYKRQPITFVVRSEKTDDKIFDKRDTPASFPGGDPAWKSYLEIMVNAHVPVDSGAPPAVYTAMVQFIVHEDGSLSDVKALTKHGYGMENEAMRVIKTGPKWIPAKQNGHIVRAYVQQPITFAIAEEDGASNQNSLQPTATTSPDIPKITVAELKKASVYKLLQLPEGTEIISFMFTMDTDGGDIIETPGNGSSFNYKIKNLINNAKPGKMITFDQIRIKKDGQEIKIPGKAYAVTN